jgi:hypothetical protein
MGLVFDFLIDGEYMSEQKPKQSKRVPKPKSPRKQESTGKDFLQIGGSPVWALPCATCRVDMLV